MFTLLCVWYGATDQSSNTHNIQHTPNYYRRRSKECWKVHYSHLLRDCDIPTDWLSLYKYHASSHHSRFQHHHNRLIIHASSLWHHLLFKCILSRPVVKCNCRNKSYLRSDKNLPPSLSVRTLFLSVLPTFLYAWRHREVRIHNRREESKRAYVKKITTRD